MSIQKKSLISTLKTAKKANVASAPVSESQKNMKGVGHSSLKGVGRSSLKGVGHSSLKGVNQRSLKGVNQRSLKKA